MAAAIPTFGEPLLVVEGMGVEPQRRCHAVAADSDSDIDVLLVRPEALADCRTVAI